MNDENWNRLQHILPQSSDENVVYIPPADFKIEDIVIYQVKNARRIENRRGIITNIDEKKDLITVKPVSKSRDITLPSYRFSHPSADDEARQKYLTKLVSLRKARAQKQENARIRRYEKDSLKYKTLNFELEGLLATYQIAFLHNRNIELALEEIRPVALRLLQDATERGTPRFKFRLQFQYTGGPEYEDEPVLSWYSDHTRTPIDGNLELALDSSVERITKDIENYASKGYEYGYDKLLRCEMDITIVPYPKLGKFVELPEELKKKSCIVNVKSTNFENDCIKWCYLAWKHSVINMDDREVSEQKYQDAKAEFEATNTDPTKKFHSRHYINKRENEENAIDGKNPNRISCYLPFEKEFDSVFDNLTDKYGVKLTYPITKEQISIVEDAFDIEIWIVSYLYIGVGIHRIGSELDPYEVSDFEGSDSGDEEKKIPSTHILRPFYVSKHHNTSRKRMNLLLYDGHLSLITNLSALYRTKNKSKRTFPCAYCGIRLYSEEALLKHERDKCGYNILNEPDTKFPDYDYCEFKTENTSNI